jgi:hypothetical protein
MDFFYIVAIDTWGFVPHSFLTSCVVIVEPETWKTMLEAKRAMQKYGTLIV